VVGAKLAYVSAFYSYSVLNCFTAVHLNEKGAAVIAAPLFKTALFLLNERSFVQ
jgi:hypothetical protein